jgi:type III restriction enzyme
VAETFFQQTIPKSTYKVPGWHAITRTGSRLTGPRDSGRRRSELIMPVPKPGTRKKTSERKQQEIILQNPKGLTDAKQEYKPTPIINEIRDHVASWRSLPNPGDWQVTPATSRLLWHRRRHSSRDPLQRHVSST